MSDKDKRPYESYTEDQKQQALLISETYSEREAARQLNIPIQLIRSWVAGAKKDPLPNKIKQLSNEALEQAKEIIIERVVEKVGPRTEQLAEKLLLTAEKAIDEIDSTLLRGSIGAKPDAWLRAVAEALEQTVKNSMLLAGKPTSRQAIEGEVKTDGSTEQLLGSLRESVDEVRIALGVKPKLYSIDGGQKPS